MKILQEEGVTLGRRERERRMRRRAMLEAAQAVFAEKGYTHATLDEIAQRAEFGKGTLYNYFEGGKEAILFAVFEEIYDDLCRLIQASFTPDRTADHPIRELFHTFISECFRFFRERQDLFMILIKEAHLMIFSEDREKSQFFIRQRQRVVEALVPPIEQAIARGELKPLPPHALAHMIIGNITGCQTHMMLEAQREEGCPAAATTFDEMATFLTTMLFDGLLSNPAPLPPTPPEHSAD